MRFLIDTNIIIALMHPTRRMAVLPKLQGRERGELVTSIMVAHELYFGAARSRHREENIALMEGMLRDIEPLEFTREDALAAADIRARLAARGTPIGPYDVLIAAQAKARGLTLVTHNVREFERVDDLSIVDWLAA